MAQLTCSIDLELPNEGIVVGTKGTLKLPASFWCPSELQTPKVALLYEPLIFPRYYFTIIIGYYEVPLALSLPTHQLCQQHRAEI